ncbi:LpxL/LpxP family acyltransferase [Chitinimonas taiwanensis]|uniref:LpxL/LpxP family acyltransferase n=1 Tax=Chitinimonas taiwanensis TaxID=240412 RepID=UPI0035AE9208
MSRLVAGLMWLLHWLPFRLMALLGSALGGLLYHLAGSRRRIGETNLRLCFPQMSEVERTRLLKAHFVAVSRMLLEYAYCWFASRERLKRMMRIEGLEHLHALEGQPVILVMPHFTGLDMAGLRVSLEVPVVSIYSKQKDAGLDAYVEQKRLRFDTGIVLSRQAGIRPALKALKQGYRFYYLPDQDFGARDSVFAPFFGVPAATITGLSRLAKASGAKALPCYPRREADGYTLVIEPPLADYPSEDVEADAARMNTVIEAQVLKQPEQYFWLHKRFKTRPPGEPDLY